MAIDVGDALLHFVGDLKPLDNAFDRMRRKSKAAGVSGAKNMRPLNAALGQIKKLVAGIGIAFLAWKVVSVLKNAVSAAGAFQTAMNRVRALTGATGEEFEKLNTKAKELGATTQFTAGQVADAMGFMAQAGFSTTEIYDSLNDTLTLAAAAQLDLATSADIVTNVMAGFGLTSEELGGAVDVLTAAFTSANTDLSQLAQAMKLAGPVAKNAGLSFEETTAAIAMMGNAGFQGSLAGTAMRRAMANLILPTGEAAKVIKELGLRIRDSQGKMLPFADILEQVAKAADPGATALRLFGVRAGPALQALIGQGIPALREMTESLKDVGGTAARIAKIQMEGFRGATLRLQSAWEALQIAFAGAGILEMVSSLATSLADFARSLADMDAAKWAPLRQALAGLAAFAKSGGAALANLILPAIGLGFTLIVGAIQAVVLTIQVLLLGFSEIIRLGAVLAQKIPFLGDRFKDLAGTVEDVAEGFSRQLVGAAANTVDSLGELVDAWRPANEILAAGAEQSKKTAKAIGDVNEEVAKLNKSLEQLAKEGEVVTVQALQAEADAALAFLRALMQTKAGAFELNQAIRKLADANKALRLAQAEVPLTLADIRASMEEVKTVGVELGDVFSTLLPTAFQELVAAQKQLGIEGTGLLIEALAKAEEAFIKMKDTGLASAADLLEGEIVIAELRFELMRQLGAAITGEQLEALEALRAKLAEIRGETDAGLTSGMLWGDFWRQITDEIGQGIKVNLSDLAIKGLKNLRTAFQQAAVAAILSGDSIGEAMKKAAAAVLAGIAAQSAVLALFETAAGFASLAILDFRGAAQHFQAAGIYAGVAVAAGIAAKAIAPKEGKVAQVFTPAGAPAGVIAGGAEEPTGIIVERKFAKGGLITRPTLALLGEQGPELVVPLRGKGGGDGRGQGAAGDGSRGTTIQMFIEGLISADNLEEVMERMSEAVKVNDARLESSSSLRVVSRE